MKASAGKSHDWQPIHPYVKDFTMPSARASATQGKRREAEIPWLGVALFGGVGLLFSTGLFVCMPKEKTVPPAMVASSPTLAELPRQAPQAVSAALPAASRETDATFEEEEEEVRPRTFKRLDRRLAEELSGELLAMPEVGLETLWGTSERLVSAARLRRHESRHLTVDLLSSRADLAGLAFRKGADCETSEAAAANLQNLSEKLHLRLAEADGVTRDQRIAELRKELSAWIAPEAVPARYKCCKSRMYRFVCCSSKCCSRF
jgi:hypothetical protein